MNSCCDLSVVYNNMLYELRSSSKLHYIECSNTKALHYSVLQAPHCSERTKNTVLIRNTDKMTPNKYTVLINTH